MLDNKLHAQLNPTPAVHRNATWAIPAPKPGAPVSEPVATRFPAPPFLALLVAAALTDWLITRTFTRFAIFIPKSPALITGFEATSWLGLVGSSLASILALMGLVWILRREWESARLPGLGLLFAILGSLSIVFLFIPSGAWSLLYNSVVILILGTLVGRSLQSHVASFRRAALLVPALAMLFAVLHQSVPALYNAMQWPGPPIWSSRFYQLGEILVVSGSIALWWAFGKTTARKSWAWGALPALLFSAAFLAEPAMTATIVVWSNGLTLFLPWWLYALALWLLGVTLISTWVTGRRSITGAILLLCAAGYAPQLSSHVFFGLIALWLLSAEYSTKSTQCEV